MYWLVPENNVECKMLMFFYDNNEENMRRIKKEF